MNTYQSQRSCICKSWQSQYMCISLVLRMMEWKWPAVTWCPSVTWCLGDRGGPRNSRQTLPLHLQSLSLSFPPLLYCWLLFPFPSIHVAMFPSQWLMCTICADVRGQTIARSCCLHWARRLAPALGTATSPLCWLANSGGECILSIEGSLSLFHSTKGKIKSLYWPGTPNPKI